MSYKREFLLLLVTFCFFCSLSALSLNGCTKSEYPPEDLAASDVPEGTPGARDSADISGFAKQLDNSPKHPPVVQPETKANPARSSFGSGSCDAMDYILGPGDEITITVTGHNEYRLVKDAEIGINGAFMFDLIGDVSADGMSASGLERNLQYRLAQDFLVNPKVSITIKKFQSHRVYLSGEVNNPGEFILKKQCQWLSEVLLDAGGLRGNFNKYAFVISGSMDIKDTSSVLRIIDLYKIFIESNRSGDQVVYDKDIIQVYDKGVNPLGPQNSIFIFGEVSKPGMYPYSNDLTVLSAILIHGGGFTKAAKKSKTEVKRKKSDQDIETLTIDLDEVMQGKKDLDIPLQPGDIIRVPRTFF